MVVPLTIIQLTPIIHSVAVSSLHGNPRGENANVVALSYGVPEVVSVARVSALGLLPVGAAVEAVIMRAKSISTEVPCV